MLIGAMPLMVAVCASASLRSLPGWKQAGGLALGFAGVVMVLLGDAAVGDAAVGDATGNATTGNATGNATLSGAALAASGTAADPTLGVGLTLLCALSFALSAAGAVRRRALAPARAHSEK